MKFELSKTNNVPNLSLVLFPPKIPRQKQWFRAIFNPYFHCKIQDSLHYFWDYCSSHKESRNNYQSKELYYKQLFDFLTGQDKCEEALV